MEHIYRFRERRLIHYNEDDYFDSIGVFDNEVISTKINLMQRIMDSLQFVNDCDFELKPSYAMMCIHLGMEFVKRFPEHENFTNAITIKIFDMLNCPCLSNHNRDILENYYTILNTRTEPL